MQIVETGGYFDGGTVYVDVEKEGTVTRFELDHSLPLDGRPRCVSVIEDGKTRILAIGSAQEKEICSSMKDLLEHEYGQDAVHSALKTSPASEKAWNDFCASHGIFSGNEGVYKDPYPNPFKGFWVDVFVFVDRAYREGKFSFDVSDGTFTNSLRCSVSEIQTSSDCGGVASDDVVNELEFKAILQLSTPLRVLTKHGEIHKDRKSPPPAYAKGEWEGIWLPKTDSKYDFLSEGTTMASEFGPIPIDQVDRVVAFLITVREVVETDLPIEERRKELFELLSNSKWSEIVSLHGRDDSIVDRLFPPFLKTIRGLSKDSITELYEANLRTPDALEKTSDEILLEVKGIGSSELQKIRETCSSTADKYAEWAD